jgi:DNA-binding NarL/FixJ family response regulator
MISVYVLDDHPLVLEGVRHALDTQPDIQVVGDECDATRACELLPALRPDVLVVDLQMASIPGLQVIRYVAREVPSTRVVPFNPVILRARISASLEKHRLRKLEAARLAQILQEQQKADRLLNVILPAAAARELKSSGFVAPRRHEQVAVLFCDIVGFTAYCDRHRPEDVVARLQLLIERFECITERHRMEKIKTIGDSFMATRWHVVLQPGSAAVGRALRPRHDRGNSRGRERLASTGRG